MRVLLIWIGVPESTRFFAIDNPSTEDLEVLTRANAGYINTFDQSEEVDAALDKVSAALTKPEYAGDHPDVDWRTKWIAGEIDENDLPSAGAFDRVFCCGFLM
jgi:hypothetical protein